jgi:hypothetical protein
VSEKGTGSRVAARGIRPWQRRLLILGILFLAAPVALQVVAVMLLGDPDFAMLEDSARGGSFVLDSEHPTAKVRFSFSATAAALEDWKTIGVHLDVDAVWSGLPGGDTPELLIRLDKVSGPEVSDRDIGVTLSCIASSNCVGGYEATFGWPPEVIEAQAHVEWLVRATATYESQPSRDAAIQVEVDPAPDLEGRPEPLFRKMSIARCLGSSDGSRLRSRIPVRTEMCTSSCSASSGPAEVATPWCSSYPAGHVSWRRANQWESPSHRGVGPDHATSTSRF